jgi:hypothetical protein
MRDLERFVRFCESEFGATITMVLAVTRIRDV